MSSQKNTTWVDFQKLKSEVGIKDILAHYGLLDGMKQSKSELRGVCPFHKETKGSFRASLDKNVFNCFGCEAKGNILDFVMLKEGVSLREAGLLIQEWFGIASERPQKAARGDKLAKKEDGKGKEGKSQEGAKAARADKGVNETPVNPVLKFSLKLDPDHPYLADRGLTPDCIKEFELGYCSRGLMKGRVAIPIRNEAGKLVAYAGRWPSEDFSDLPEGEDKYKLPPNFKKSLVIFNLHRAVRELGEGDCLILVEGFFDCFSLWMAGYKNVAALMGSSMSEEQEALIAETLTPVTRLLLWFDDDEAGQKCADDVISRLADRVFVKKTRVEGRQPDQLTTEEIVEVLGG